jgi:hypothetical protein
MEIVKQYVIDQSTKTVTDALIEQIHVLILHENQIENINAALHSQILMKDVKEKDVH